MSNWLTTEERKLKALFLTVPIEHVCVELPRHSPKAIASHARRLGLKRKGNGSNNVVNASRHPLILTLIRERRLRGISQTKLAIDMDVDRASLCRIEGGRRLPTMRILQRWCEALGMEIKIERVSR